MDIDPPQSFPKLLSSPNSIYIYPIHSYASQRIQPNPLPKSNDGPLSKAKNVAKNKYKKPRININDGLKDFIVDDNEIEDDVGITTSNKKYPELILDHKYDGVRIIFLI